jgi:radical SAM superfamily enzyme YgiQ (UPF0313 family)
MPLGLPCLGAVLRKHGHEVAALDLNFPAHRIPDRYLKADMEVVGRIRAFRPDILGISTTTCQRYNARFWAGLIKSFIPGLKVVVGGPHVSYTSHQVLERWKAVDYVIRFEGEVPLVKLLEQLSKNGDLAEVPALVYRDGDGKVVETERAKQVPDLDSLPMPDWTVYEDIDAMIMNYSPTMMRDGPWLTGPTVHTLTSRGCPFLCKFCSTSEFWKGKTRFRSAENVVEELKQLRARWPMVENLIFHDDTITLRRKHIEGICELMLREGLKFKWKAWSRLDVLDKPLLDLMREAGCAVLMCGAESGTERGLQLVGKKVKLKRLVENTRMIEESGIGTLYSFIAGIPGETKAEAMTTIEMVRKLESPYAIANVYHGTTIFPGTAFCMDFERAHGPIDWENPALSMRPYFGNDSLGNPLAPNVGFPAEVVAELSAALGLPSVAQLQPSTSSRARARTLHKLYLDDVQRWSPFVLPQLEEVAFVMASAVDVPQPKVLCLSGRSKESVLSVSISDTYEDVVKLTLPNEVLQGFPEADGMIDPAFARLPSSGFHLVIDLNTLSDLREVVRRNVALQIRRTLAVDGTAVFLFQNSDDLGARAGRILGMGKSVAAQRRPSVKAFRAMLETAGFAIISERSAGIGMHYMIRSRLSPRVAHAISRLRLPKSLGAWSMFVCGKESQAMDIVSPAPSVEIASPVQPAGVASPSEPPKIANPAPATVEKSRDTVTS